MNLVVINLRTGLPSRTAFMYRVSWAMWGLQTDMAQLAIEMLYQLPSLGDLVTQSTCIAK